jgi:hypothetical protein
MSRFRPFTLPPTVVASSRTTPFTYTAAAVTSAARWRTASTGRRYQGALLLSPSLTSSGAPAEQPALQRGEDTKDWASATELELASILLCISTSSARRLQGTTPALMTPLSASGDATFSVCGLGPGMVVGVYNTMSVHVSGTAVVGRGFHSQRIEQEPHQCK